MLRWIERTRKKPKVVRDQYAFLGALTVTGLIALVWFVSLPSHFADIEVEGEAEREAVGAFSRFMREARSNLASVFSATESEVRQEEGDEAANASSSNERVVPQLSEENINALREKQEDAQRPAARTVLIATSSPAASTTASSSAAEQ